VVTDENVEKRQEPQVPDLGPARRQLMYRVMAGAVIACLLAAGAGYWFLTRNQETTDDAFIEANVVQIAPRIAGTVRTIHIDDNQKVASGDLLVELDPGDYESALAQAQGALRAARADKKVARRQLELTQKTTAAQLRQAKAQVALSEAAVKEAEDRAAADQAQVDYDQAEVSRYNKLAAATFATQEQLDQATAALKSAEAGLKADQQAIVVAQAQLAEAKAQLEAADTAAEQIAEKQGELEAAVAKVASAEAAVRAAEINLSYTEIHAPGEGFVTNRSVHPGNAVEPGQALTSLVVDRPWVVANFKETQLSRMRPGQQVDISIDAYPGTVLHGHVDSIQRGSGAAFSLLPPENATGNYVKIVQRVPVKIVIDDPLGSAMVLGPGLSVEATVYFGPALPTRDATVRS
jgi:membrane fusion protein (multidrug efflux system)